MLFNGCLNNKGKHQRYKESPKRGTILPHTNQSVKIFNFQKVWFFIRRFFYFLSKALIPQFIFRAKYYRACAEELCVFFCEMFLFASEIIKIISLAKSKKQKKRKSEINQNAEKISRNISLEI